MTKLSAWKMAGAALMLCGATAIATQGQTFTTLVEFDETNGANPAYMSLAQGIDGNFYGTTTAGGAHEEGTVFRISPDGALTTIYGFCTRRNCTDGYEPSGPLFLGTDGDFYGTTQFGGNLNGGTVFKISSTGRLTTLYRFCSEENCTDGEWPFGGVVEGIDGDFYGTTEFGGSVGCGGGNACGTVFKLSRTGKLTTLYDFSYEVGTQPGRLTLGTDGNFYGITHNGGPNACPGGYQCGTVFKITPRGKFTTLYNFDSSGGYYPFDGLILADDGNFYGTTTYGGANDACNNGIGGCGTAFEVTPGGTLTTLYNFCALSNCADGDTPAATLVQATDGNFYGTTAAGGDPSCNPPNEGCGTIFGITPSGSLTVLHTFEGSDGSYPAGQLFQATNGVLYGTTFEGANPGCQYGCGTLFSLDMGFGPFIVFVRPYAKVSGLAGILGQGFTGTTSVSLNGIPASFTVVSDTFIKATVPAGATTGYVTVTTPSGMLTSNVPFHVIP